MKPPKDILGDNLGTELVTLHVGKKCKEFVVHKRLICCKSDYFAKAFTSSFMESNGIMYLPDDSPDVFTIFVNWLYRNTIPDVPTRDYFINLFKLYIFAEKICNNEVANRTMDRIRATVSYNWGISTTPALASYIYKNTFSDSPLRRYCTRDLAYYLWSSDEDFETDGFATTFPDESQLKQLFKYSRGQQDLFVDYFSYLRLNPTEIEADDLWDHRGCMFHRHAEGEECYTKDPHEVFQNPVRWPEEEPRLTDIEDFSTYES